MAENPNQPREYDAVLGGQNPPPTNGVVLGGIEGIKHRLASNNVEVRVAALSDALPYGDAGLDLVIQGLQSESVEVKNAAVMLLQGRTDTAAKLALLLQTEPKNAYAYHQRGNDRFNLGDYQGAIVDFSLAIAAATVRNKPILYYNTGLCRKLLEDYQGAIDDFSQAIQIDPNQFIAYTARGNAHLALGDTTKAELDFQKAIDIEQRL